MSIVLERGKKMARIVLITGGARSGKSQFAEQYLQACPGRHGYIATAQVLDDEMADRVARHRSRRPASWQTFEVPSGLGNQIDHILQQTDNILLDCLTLYFSNFLLQRDGDDFSHILKEAENEWDGVLRAVRQSRDGVFVVVTNELGSGIVPMAKVSRQYRDLIGFLNQHTAAEADEVYLSVCGITMEIKSRQVRLPLREERP